MIASALQSSRQSTPLTITLFGPMRVQVEGQPLPRLRSRKVLWLLALLALRHGRPVEREWLAETLWPDIDPSNASANLRVALSELRRALGSQGRRLETPGRHTLSLDLTGAEADVAAFDADIADGAPASLARAAALYQGPLLEGCTEEWVGQERTAREQDCLRALATLAEAALAAGDADTAADYYRRAVSLNPWQEGARRGLMEALAQKGDANAALQVYREFLLLLREDPRAAPDARTSALYARLRSDARRQSADSQSATPPSVPAAPGGTEGAAAPSITGSLPRPLTDLVGREQESLEVTARLRRARLVTLTGPGGIGKTRLALAVAAEAAPEYADGVWLVALDALADGSLVAGQIAGVLGLKEEPGRTLGQSLAGALRSKRLLLVLDNCEHVLDGCADLVWDLLGECAGARVLATSREALGITGEAAWAVPGLSVPDPAHLPAGGATLVRVLAGYESVQLFVERAQSIQKTFALTGKNALPVAQICARLEGLPLAIELAAARVRALTVGEIAARLDDSLSLLTGGSRVAQSRQQTLRATLDWSYSLLGAAEQFLLARVSVFAGGWSLDAAEAVCAGEGLASGQVLDLLTRLVDKSLVVYDEPGSSDAGRYRLLETVRQYAAERLGTGDAADRLRAGHREWFAALAVRAKGEMRGADQVSWLRRLETDHANLRAALTRTGSSTDAVGAETRLRMVGALWWFWYIRGYLSEGRELLAGALQPEDVQAPTVARGTALNGAGTLSGVLGDLDAARAFFEESLSIFQTLADRSNVAVALGNLGNIAALQGDNEGARARFAESLAVFREIGKPQRIAALLGNLAQIAVNQGDYDAAWAMNTEALELFRALQDKHGSARTMNGLGAVGYHREEYAQAEALYGESLTLFRELEDKGGVSDALSGLGDLERQRGHFDDARALYRESLLLRRELGVKKEIEFSLREFAHLLLRQREPGRAVRLWGAAEALRETLGSQLSPDVQRLLEERIAEARAALSEPEFAAARQAGRALTWEQAVDDAMEQEAASEKTAK